MIRSRSVGGGQDNYSGMKLIKGIFSYSLLTSRAAAVLTEKFSCGVLDCVWWHLWASFEGGEWWTRNEGRGTRKSSDKSSVQFWSRQRWCLRVFVQNLLFPHHKKCYESFIFPGKDRLIMCLPRCLASGGLSGLLILYSKTKHHELFLGQSVNSRSSQTFVLTSLTNDQVHFGQHHLQSCFTRLHLNSF